MDLKAGRPLTVSEITTLLHEARGRTLLLISSLTDDELRQQHDPLMSPIVWDLGHIAHFEEVWLLQNVQGDGPGSEGLAGMYNPFENPRGTRDQLPLPGARNAALYMSRIRRAVLENLPGLDLSADTPLLRDGFVFRMVLQHEYQHNETILQTLQLKQGDPYRAPRAVAVPDPRPSLGADETGRPSLGAEPPPDEMILFPGGRVEIGTDDASDSYDNERPAHFVDLPAFLIDRDPTSNADFLAFMANGGYQREEFWSPEGFAWVTSEGIRAPKYWSERDGEWWTRVMDMERMLDAHRPVIHVCFWEAEAYASWAGKRLPTEFEWEAAARLDPASGLNRRFPWGDDAPNPALANIDVLSFDTAPNGSYPANVSAIGARDMIGNIWEWTSTDFHGYPGYQTFPYPEYSEVFFGTDYKVLRGGSWATRSGAIRSTFRNWDYPIRRQIFAGFRCAADV